MLRRLEPGRAIHWRDGRRSRVAEATSRADVLGGQLAEATERPVEPSARAGFPEEPRRRWPRRGANRFLRGGDPPTVLPSEAGSDSAEGGVDAEGAAAPQLISDPAGTVYLVVCVCFLRPPRPKHIIVVL
jgi:hypothetical protein